MYLGEALACYFKVCRKDWASGKYVTLNRFGEVRDQDSHKIELGVEYLFDNWEGYVEPVLTSEEHDYLANIIKPFEDRVSTIQKIAVNDKEYRIIICVTSEDKKTCYYINLPPFEKDSMYKNMDEGKLYYLLELGLCTM